MPLEMALVVVFGLIIGSFLNVCIYRIPRKVSLVRPARSFCPECHSRLSAWENIPVLSWLLLRGKCRHCDSAIPERYPLVEILSAIAASASYLHYGISPTGTLVYALSASLLVISFIDADFKIIPNVITFSGMILGFLIAISERYLNNFAYPIASGPLDSLFGFALGIGLFHGIALVYYCATKREGLGGGDVKLMGMLGAILGWRAILPTMFVGSLLGAVAGILLMIFKGGGRHTELPFGPWLAVGAFVYLFANLPLFRF